MSSLTHQKPVVLQVMHKSDLSFTAKINKRYDQLHCDHEVVLSALEGVRS
jgi:hypothetical protein